MNLDKLIDIYKQVILTHHRNRTLLATKQTPTDPDEHLKCDETDPLYVRDRYHHADTTGKLLYGITAFSSNPTEHQGKTKQEIIHQHAAFTILLTEDLPNIPRAGNGHIVGGRPQLEAGKTSRDYLSLLGTPPYDHEIGMTPEDHLIYAILHLENTNQVIDDYQGHGSLSRQIGACFLSSDASDVVLPFSCWDRLFRRAHLDETYPASRGEYGGVRSAVRVSP